MIPVVKAVTLAGCTDRIGDLTHFRGFVTQLLALKTNSAPKNTNARTKKKFLAFSLALQYSSFFHNPSFVSIISFVLRLRLHSYSFSLLHHHHPAYHHPIHPLFHGEHFYCHSAILSPYYHCF